MNIGIIYDEYPPVQIGGVELQARALARKLSVRGHRVVVFSASGTNEVINENPNLRIIRFRYKNIKYLRIFLAQLIALWPWIRKEASRLDALLCYQVCPPGVIGFFLKCAYGKPFVTWIRAESEYRSPLMRYLFAPLSLAAADRVFVQTPKMKRDMISLYSKGKQVWINRQRLERIEVISNGVEIKNSRAVPYEERDGILFVGRLVASKGLEYLISATKGTNEKLSIIGDGPEKKSLMNRASGSDVQFLGKLGQEEVFDHMRKAKALVLPSIFGEGLPNVILEAMSAGAPVISTSVGGIPDVLEDGKTGFVVEPKNVESLRRSILVLIRNKGIWHNIHTNCLSEAKKYSWEQVERKVMEELEKTLQRARQTRFHPGG